MKLLSLHRLNSGLRNSVRDGKWQPAGVPTVYKFIEALDNSAHDVQFCLAEKETGPDGTKNDQAVAVAGLSRPLHILTPPSFVTRAPRRLVPHLVELAQLCKFYFLARRAAPDIVYVDRSNVLAGAVLARGSNCPVVLRVMGIAPDMHGMLDDFRPYSRLLRWAYRAPFALVIGTQDGSGCEHWFDRTLAPSVPRRILLNGVDRMLPANPPAALPAAKEGDMTVSFIGRLEELKGCDEFVEAILQLPADCAARIHGVIVGDGSRRQALETKAATATNGARLSFLGLLDHAAVGAVLNRSDVYVSLNRQGNLSNANLEAFSAGLCTIIASPVAGRDTDRETHRLFPEEVVLRLPRENEVDALTATLVRLLRDPGERQRRARALAQRAAEILPNWKQRIDNEIALLESLAAGAWLTGDNTETTDRPAPKAARPGV